MKSLLKKLTETASPSGYEGPIRELIRSEVAPLAREVTVDALGNLIVHLGEKTPRGLKILIDAHMDEIGFMVSHVEKNGLIRFSALGGLFPRYLAGARVVFLDGTRGTINSDRQEDKKTIPSIEEHYIDVGAASDRDCPVAIGSVGVLDEPFYDLGRRVMAKSLDNRSSCAALIETIKRIKSTPHELVFVFSAQEETQTRGATTASYAVEPDLAIAVDVTPSLDILGVKMQVDLAKGPAIKLRDTGMLSDPGVVKWMEKTAAKEHMPCQREVLDVRTTNARVMQVSRAGVPCGVISIPCRHVHSPSEMIDLQDLEYTVALLTALLSNPKID